jgi:hypothetical protein
MLDYWRVVALWGFYHLILLMLIYVVEQIIFFLKINVLNSHIELYGDLDAGKLTDVFFLRSEMIERVVIQQ